MESQSIKCAGDDYNAAMIKYIRRKYNLLIGEQTAENAKIAIGSVYERPEELTYTVKGRDLIRGLPKGITINANETIEAFSEPTMQILNAIHGILEVAPPELVADISVSGITLTGGGSLMYGMDKLIKEKTGIDTYVSDRALEAVVLGAGMAEDIPEYSRGTE